MTHDVHVAATRTAAVVAATVDELVAGRDCRRQVLRVRPARGRGLSSGPTFVHDELSR